MNKPKDIDFEFANKWEKIRKREMESKSAKCLCPHCDEDATYCHVFQQANILNPMGENGEIRIFEFTPIYYGGKPEYKLGGISKSFGFYGFCDKHDSILFKPIEENVNEDTWKKIESQYLLAYKTVACHKIRGERALKVYAEFPDKDTYNQEDALKRDIDLSKYYYEVIENGIVNQDYSKLDFFFHILPHRVDIASADCLYFNEPLYFGPVEKREYYICMFFPFEDKTIIIIGYKKNNPTPWLDELKPLFQSAKKEENYIAINNVLIGSYFHCMSPSYYDQIPKEMVAKFIEDWKERMQTV